LWCRPDVTSDGPINTIEMSAMKSILNLLKKKLLSCNDNKFTSCGDSKAETWIDTHITGTISGDGAMVIIDKNAVIHGNVNVNIAIVNGFVDGVIRAEKKVELYSPALVNGEIYAPLTVVEAGVTINGKCFQKPTILLGDIMKS